MVSQLVMAVMVARTPGLRIDESSSPNTPPGPEHGEDGLVAVGGEHPDRHAPAAEQVHRVRRVAVVEERLAAG